MSLIKIRSEIKKASNQPLAKFLQRFFKTGKGGYAEGDKFLGLRVPQSRLIAKKYRDLDFPSIQTLLKSSFHEERLIALLILVDKFKQDPTRVYKFYLAHTKYINNWDLVDLSADKIVGKYLLDKDQSILKKLARSQNIWERRIAMISTFEFIKNGKYNKTLELAKLLLTDKHDLMHKATGWMLREVGKRDERVLVKFLNHYTTRLPRTALRYAIERFDEKRRKAYLLRK